MKSGDLITVKSDGARAIIVATDPAMEVLITYNRAIPRSTVNEFRSVTPTSVEILCASPCACGGVCNPTGIGLPTNTPEV
jgi:hypothetical protein